MCFATSFSGSDDPHWQGKEAQKVAAKEFGLMPASNWTLAQMTPEEIRSMQNRPPLTPEEVMNNQRMMQNANPILVPEGPSRERQEAAKRVSLEKWALIALNVLTPVGLSVWLWIKIHQG